MPRYDVTAIGEGGLRLSVSAGDQLERARTLDVQIAGTEANVLCALSSLGWSTAWFSALPDSPLGRRVETEYRSYGVDLSGVRRVPDGQIGTYFVEYGTAPRPTQVYYQRAETAFSKITTADIDWARLLDTRLVHITGLTAALSQPVRDVLNELASRAEAAGIPFSFDVNFRHNLSAPEAARSVMLDFMRAAEITFCRAQDAELLFGITGDSTERVHRLQALADCQHVVMTLGADGFIALLDGHLMERPAIRVDVIDRLGAGDAFAAGFLHGWLSGDIDRAAVSGPTLAALALSQRGEQVAITANELQHLIDNPGHNLRR